MTSSAVLFGIQYFGSDNVLQGTRQDAEVLGECLTKTLGIDQVRIYTDTTTPEQVTRDGILEVLWTLCTQSYSQDLERAWIFYSGHLTDSF